MKNPKIEKCEHIYGYDEGYGWGDPDDEELPCLGKLEGIYDVQFNYCPLCGVKFGDSKTKQGKKEKS